MRSYLDGQRHRRTMLAGVLALAALLTACSGGASSTGSTTVRFGVFSWNAASITSHILARIAKENPQLGVEKVEFKKLSTSMGWVGLEGGEVDVLAEVAWPNQKPLYQKYKEETALLSETYNKAAQGWFVPSYVVQQGGAAPQLESVTQLDQHKKTFEGKLYDANAGWITTKWNTKRLKAYGLQYKHVTSSESAMIAQVKSAFSDKQPVLFYLWHPHWVFAKYDLTQLEEAKPYKKGCFDKASMGPCAMPDYSAKVAARKDLQDKAPKFYAFLKQFELDVPVLEKMLAKTRGEKHSPKEVAKQWVTSHQSKIESWVNASTKS